METVLYNNKNTVKILQMIFMNYISIIYITKSAGCVRIGFTGTSPREANT